MSNNVGDLGRRVSERRRELGLSVEELATRAGMDPFYVRSLEASPSPQLTRAALWRLAAALETTMDSVTGSGTQTPPGQSGPGPSPVLDAIDDTSQPGADQFPVGWGGWCSTESRGPVALPVNYRILDGDVVFRTAPIPELTANLKVGQVSFEVDHIDEALAEGWSVLISGTGHVVVDPGERRQVEAVGVEPWAGGDRDVYIRIAPTQVTGRRIRRR